jgi:glutamyl-tRNA reductase
VLIDIAVPRNIAADVQEISNVYLYDVDDLEVIVRENVKHREQEVVRCESIIGQRTDAVLVKIAPAREKACDTGGASRPAWMFNRAAACVS